ncbi:hypothetical protein CI109_102193 [Kwoniella shandongensis]|uniref:Response regulatory domain-containing protein n=1 Tax=Kwoniella shandongensis TaxID=1734106 RepID=A0AAJ8LHA1_9TREE
MEVDQRTSQLQNALAAKTQFLSQCSHELRSPLSAVLGLAAVLEESTGLSAVQREHIGTIQSSAHDLLGLINNILDHARLESNSVILERIPFTLREVVEGALDTIAPAAQAKDVEVCLITSFKEDPPGLLGDPFRVKQGIGIPAEKMDKLFKSFSQVDSSITRNHGGSGLGLIISKDLAVLLEGNCTASSEYGKGSSFEFTFKTETSPEGERHWQRFEKSKSCFIVCPAHPWWEMLEQKCENFSQKLSLDLTKSMRDFGIARETIVARPIKFESLYNALRNGLDGVKDASRVKHKKLINKLFAKSHPLKILVVDDNSVNLTVGKRVLELFGYTQVDLASCGLDAIQAAESQRFDLILLDLQMPMLDGFSTHDRLKQSPLSGNPCVVALSANVDQDTRRRCDESAFFGFLAKPIDIPKLNNILLRAFEYQHRGCLTPPPQG